MWGPSSSLLMVCSGPCHMFCCSSDLCPLGASRALWLSLDFAVTARMAASWRMDGYNVRPLIQEDNLAVLLVPYLKCVWNPSLTLKRRTWFTTLLE